jgi:hypothetical protein
MTHRHAIRDTADIEHWTDATRRYTRQVIDTGWYVT